jgi:metallophosphoesterase superfamily enzyme
MKISVLSDIHLDFYIVPGGSESSIKRKLKVLFKDTLTDSSDVEVLIVAGDITHYPYQMHILDLLAETFNYKKVICVTGNHELYLVSNSQRATYSDSKAKLKEYLEYSSDKVVMLNGNTYEYKGVTFGGAMGWYDGTYQNEDSRGSNVAYNLLTMNDFRSTKGFKDFYEVFELEYPKFTQEVLDADVIISHFCPLTEPKAFQTVYRYDESSRFYAFNGEDLISRAKAKHWVFGHSHGFHEFEHAGIQFTLNAFGYPSENGAINKVLEV